MNVYADVIFTVNLIMDLMVLAAVNRLLDYRASLRRLLAGAAIGGGWACAAAVFPGMPLWLYTLGTYVAAGRAMAGIAYRIREPKELVRAVAAVYLVSVVMGGVIQCLRESLSKAVRSDQAAWTGAGGYSAVARILMALGGFLGCLAAAEWFRSTIRAMIRRGDLCRVTLRSGDREETVWGLIDTGNRLREPVSGRPVHVAVRGLMERICPKTGKILYVPYVSVGRSGVLPAVVLDEMQVEQRGKRYRISKPLVAVWREPLSPEGEYEILIQKSDGA